jgi:hypothetical protein
MIERRKHRRIVTLKNFGRFTLVALLALAAMNVVSEHRAPREHEYAPPVQQAPFVSTPAPEVIHEAPVIPSVARDLGGGAAPQPPAQIPRYARDDNGTIAIAGDESGITITTPTHRLRGGFFRQ